MRKYLLTFLISLWMVNDATAGVWRISRACRWDWVPSCIYILGRTDLPCMWKVLVPNSGKYNTAPKAYWVLESFTTDYMPAVQFPDVRRTRNWLWASMYAWRSAYSPEIMSYLGWNPATLPPEYFIAWGAIHSGWMVKWTTNEWPFPADYMYFRARAGTGTWLDFFVYMGYEDGYSDSWSFRVIGRHYVADSQNPQIQDAGTTLITNACDLGNWGFYGESNSSI